MVVLLPGGFMQSRKMLYLVLCIAGITLTYWQFVPWLAENGLNFSLFYRQLFANRVSSFFALDVLVSAVVLIAFFNSEDAGLTRVQRLAPIIALVFVGVSAALPLFLYFRETNRESLAASRANGVSIG